MMQIGNICPTICSKPSEVTRMEDEANVWPGSINRQTERANEVDQGVQSRNDS